MEGVRLPLFDKASLRVCVRTLDRIRGKIEGLTEVDLTCVCACVRVCTGGVQQGYKWWLDKFEKMLRKSFATEVLDKAWNCGVI